MVICIHSASKRENGKKLWDKTFSLFSYTNLVTAPPGDDKSEFSVACRSQDEVTNALSFSTFLSYSHFFYVDIFLHISVHSSSPLSSNKSSFSSILPANYFSKKNYCNLIHFIYEKKKKEIIITIINSQRWI